MTPQQNIDLVRRGYDAFGRGDIDALLALFDENIEWVMPGPPDLPVSGTRRGRQAVATFFTALDNLLDIQRFEPKEFIAEGDRVVVLGEDTSRVKATGKTIDSQWAQVFTVRNGKVVRFHEYSDMSALVEELRGSRAAGSRR